MIRDRARTIAAALTAAILAAPAAAQDGPATVPTELAAGLLRG